MLIKTHCKRILCLIVAFISTSKAQTFIQDVTVTGIQPYYCSGQPVSFVIENSQANIRYTPILFSTLTGTNIRLPSVIGNGGNITISVPQSNLNEGTNRLTVEAEIQVNREPGGSLPRVFTAMRTPTKPNIDGLLQESVWNMAGNLTRNALGVISNTVSFSVLWDDDGLYIAARVTDNEINTSTTNRDLIRLFFDPSVDQNKGDFYNTVTQSCGSAGIYGVFFSRYNFGSFGVLSTSISGCLPPGVSITNPARGYNRLSTGGYIAEFDFPWTSLGINLNARRAQLTTTGIGFDIMKDEVTGGNLLARSAWNGTNDNEFSNNGFGRLVFSPLNNPVQSLSTVRNIILVKVAPPPGSDSTLTRVTCGTTIITRGNLPDGREGNLERLFWQFSNNSIDTSILSETFGPRRNYTVPAGQLGFGRVYLRTQDLRYRRCWSAQSSVFNYEVRQSPRAPTGIDGSDGGCEKAIITPRDSMRIIDAQGLRYFWQTNSTDTSKSDPVDPANPRKEITFTSNWYLRARYKDAGGASCWSQSQQSPSKFVIVETPPTTPPSAGLTIVQEGCGVVTVTSASNTLSGITFYAVIGSEGNQVDYPVNPTGQVRQTGTYFLRPRTNLGGCFGPANNSPIFINVGNPNITAPIPLTTPITIEQFSSPKPLEVILEENAVAKWYTSESATEGFLAPFKPDSSTLGSRTYYVSQIQGKCESPRATVEVITVLPEVPELKNIGFTPNGDNINDNLKIQFIEKYPNPKLTIIDKWGSVLYEKQPYKNDFDGSVNGKKLPAGVYSFVLDLDESQKPRIGTVSIIY